MKISELIMELANMQINFGDIKVVSQQKPDEGIFCTENIKYTAVTADGEGKYMAVLYTY
jgi:hypothetical protein